MAIPVPEQKQPTSGYQSAPSLLLRVAATTYEWSDVAYFND